MIITFRTARLETTFNKEKALVREYGTVNARQIARRMAVLRAAPTLSSVPTIKPDRCHPLKGNRQGQYAVDLAHPHRLVFRPNHDPIPTRPGGSVDMAAITAIEIVDLEDYH